MSELRWSELRVMPVAIFLALVIFCGLLLYVGVTSPHEEGSISIYVLDSQKMAKEYPQVLVLNGNSTIFLWVGVENFKGRVEYCSVIVKVDNGTVQTDPNPIEPVKQFERVLLDRETWEFRVELSLNQTGNYRMILELWLFDELENVFVYSGSWCSQRFALIES